ncbi:major facilitator superfamily domain-containing protein [Zychaea mexicana]|uniref:major facilitator superfamily domain-containing protein n=1 Tax=Zychaea mexicana TaxID=64656 RepID=UPI0022FEA171|nr:major facilitator superfamily domain-containing protein [Zychaea mexicana]KAI9491064.1 major facilitator superfamily domain-containing protein [Zychaea mexicana]
MPIRSLVTRAIAPTTTVDGQEKQHQQPEETKRKKPFLLNVRSSDYFIFATAAIGLFTSTFVHSILFPLSPFIIDRINHKDDVSHDYNTSPFSASSDAETSRDTGILVASYAVGLLGDKIRQRRIPMLLGISASIAANLMFMFAIAYWMLLLARFLQGVSNACVWTMSLCLVADNWPESQLGYQMGKLFGFYPLGIVTGLPIGECVKSCMLTIPPSPLNIPLITGILYSKLGHQAPFIASMVLCGIDFFMRLVIVERCHLPKEWFIKPEDEENTPKDSQQPAAEAPFSQHQLPNISTTHTNISSCYSLSDEFNNHDGSNTNSNQTRHKVTLLQLLRQPRLLVSLNLTVVVATVMSSFETILTMRLATEWHFDEATCGLILLSFMVPSIVSAAFSGWLCDRYGTKIVALISLVLIVPVVFLVTIPNRNTSYWTLIIYFILGGAAMAGSQSTVFPEIAGVVASANKSSSEKDGMATSYALFNAAYGTGMSLGPILAGFVYGSIGFFWLCAILAFMFLICIPFAYLYTGQSRQLIDRSKKITHTITMTSLSLPSQQCNTGTCAVNNNTLQQHPSRHCPPPTLFLNNNPHNNSSTHNNNSSTISTTNNS